VAFAGRPGEAVVRYPPVSQSRRQILQLGGIAAASVPTSRGPAAHAATHQRGTAANSSMRWQGTVPASFFCTRRHGTSPIVWSSSRGSRGSLPTSCTTHAVIRPLTCLRTKSPHSGFQRLRWLVNSMRLVASPANTWRRRYQVHGSRCSPQLATPSTSRTPAILNRLVMDFVSAIGARW